MSILYVAVVADLKADYGRSKRSHGDWASFIGSNRTEVIQRALAARASWASAGAYKIYFGVLTEEETASGWKMVEPLAERPKAPKPLSPEPRVRRPDPDILSDDDIPF